MEYLENTDVRDIELTLLDLLGERIRNIIENRLDIICDVSSYHFGISSINQNNVNAEFLITTDVCRVTNANRTDIPSFCGYLGVYNRGLVSEDIEGFLREGNGSKFPNYIVISPVLVHATNKFLFHEDKRTVTYFVFIELTMNFCDVRNS